MERTYLCCDLKSYYASVECIDRGLDPMAINLVVADAARTDKTICLAVSPALKSFGISGRPRLFEVKQRVRDINYERRMRLPSKAFWDKSCDLRELQNDPTLELDYIIVPPRMRRYMEVSAKIHGIFLKYFSAEDIHVYSIDEVFVDLSAISSVLSAFGACTGGKGGKCGVSNNGNHSHSRHWHKSVSGEDCYGYFGEKNARR